METLLELLWEVRPSGEPDTPEYYPGKRSNVDVNAQTWAGWTALHHAATAGYKDIAFELLRAGADTEIKLVLNGYTPYMLACEGENAHPGVEGHQEIVALLLDAGADPEIRDHEHWRTGRQLAERRSLAPKSGIGTAEKRRLGGMAMVAWLDKLDEMAEEEAKAAEEAAEKAAEQAEAAEEADAGEEGQNNDESTQGEIQAAQGDGDADG